jgi:hypothetical protein
MQAAPVLHPSHLYQNAVCDTIGWLGGYPFEVAKPEAIFDFYRARR